MNIQTENKTKQKKLIIIGFYGYSNSGKTTLIERLIRQLKYEGYNLAAVKVSDHDIQMDEPGKDSWRYAQAGAGTVVLAAQNETGFMVNAALDMRKILDAVAILLAPDVVIVEGANDNFTRKIRLGEIEERINTIWTYDGEYDHLVEFIHKEINKE